MCELVKFASNVTIAARVQSVTSLCFFQLWIFFAFCLLELSVLCEMVKCLLFRLESNLFFLELPYVKVHER